MGNSLTVMTSPARMLRAVGSWRFQKSFKARTFRIPDASEDKGRREERRYQSTGGKRAVQGRWREKTREGIRKNRTLILQEGLSHWILPAERMGGSLMGLGC